MTIENVGDDKVLFEEVYQLYRAHNQTLGFMPRGAFEDRAAAGTLMVALDSEGSLTGYLLYDLPLRHIVIRHLCIDISRRGSGVARALIAELKSRHPEREGITARCRNDFAAHRLWPRLDFEPLNERPGRGSEGLLLTRWWLDFGHPNLFSTFAEQGQRFLVAIDTDVFIDLIEDRPGSVESNGLISDWVVDVAELVITKSVVQDIHNNTDSTVRFQRRAQLTDFRRVDAATDNWEEAEAQIVEKLGGAIMTEHDRLDVQHVARAAAAHVGYFASRDENLLRRIRGPAWELFQLKVGSPTELLAELWGQVAGPYTPAMIENTNFRLEIPTPDEDDELYEVFSNRGGGERKWEFSQGLKMSRADPQRRELRVLRSSGGSAVALIARTNAGERIQVNLLRVAGSNASTIGRQVAHVLRDYAISVRATTIVISDPNMSSQLSEGLAAEGFVEVGKQWWSVVLDVHAGATEIADVIDRMGDMPAEIGTGLVIDKLRSEDVTASDVIELERRFSPLKVAGTTLPTYVVPIKPVWAEQLFDTDLSSTTLFSRHDGLGISREHVYYSGAARGEFGPPARILWYVSTDPQRAGTGAVRATSKVEEVVVGRPLDLFRRFSRLGVYQREQVLQMGLKRGRLMAIRFSDTEAFEYPIEHKEFREIVKMCGHNVVLRSPQRLPDDVFDIAYERGMHGSI